jgi:hypothetical protein
MKKKLNKWLYWIVKSTIVVSALIYLYKTAEFNQTSITFNILNYKVYTTSGFVLAFFAILFFIFIKTLVTTLRLRYIFKTKNAINLYKTIIKQIRNQDDKKLLSEYLKKIDKRGFLKTFNQHLKIENIRYYDLYIKNISVQKQLKIALALYNKNKTNSTACYIYSKALFANSDFANAKAILTDFIDYKSILIENAKTMYLMSKLIIECESKLSESFDFVQKYLDYIETYEKNAG